MPRLGPKGKPCRMAVAYGLQHDSTGETLLGKVPGLLWLVGCQERLGAYYRAPRGVEYSAVGTPLHSGGYRVAHSGCQQGVTSGNCSFLETFGM